MTLNQLKAVIWARNSNFFAIGGYTIADLDTIIAEAILLAGGTVADPTSPTNAEVGAIEDYLMILCTEYTAIDFLIDALPLNEIKTGPITEKLNQLIEQLERKLARIKKKLDDMYGLFLGELEVGILNLNFQEPYDA